MTRALRGLAAALAYYTIIPIGRRATHEAPGPAALEWLPPIGAAVGAVAGWGGYAAFAWLHVSWGFAVAWALTIVLTGALHVDGFLDSCDGLFASVPPQRRLEILKDPHHGSFAIAGMAIATAFWLSALAAIAPSRYPLVLAFSGALARYVAVVQARFFPYARPAGLAASFVRPPNALALVAIGLAIEGLAWWIAPWTLAIGPVALLGAWLAARWSSRRLGGGLTGDVYGGAIVVAEIGILLAVCVIVRR
ncbi:MAG TPA: adenosylcobinamide-GDP ribazoletransferase [Candidatus Tumulicola sp.]